MSKKKTHLTGIPAFQTDYSSYAKAFLRSHKVPNTNVRAYVEAEVGDILPPKDLERLAFEIERERRDNAAYQDAPPQEDAMWR